VADMTPKDIADRTGLSTDTVKKALKNEMLTGYRVGGRGDWRITEASFEDWMARGAPTAPPKGNTSYAAQNKPKEPK
jgi:excisionase family DNA binding protein